MIILILICNHVTTCNHQTDIPLIRIYIKLQTQKIIAYIEKSSKGGYGGYKKLQIRIIKAINYVSTHLKKWLQGGYMWLQKGETWSFMTTKMI